MTSVSFHQFISHFLLGLINNYFQFQVSGALSSAPTMPLSLPELLDTHVTSLYFCTSLKFLNMNSTLERNFWTRVWVWGCIYICKRGREQVESEGNGHKREQGKIMKNFSQKSFYPQAFWKSIAYNAYPLFPHPQPALTNVTVLSLLTNHETRAHKIWQMEGALKTI